jgi:hypothetical protein
MNSRHFLRFALLGWTLVLSACSSFNRDFKAAAAMAPAPARKAEPFGGPWAGRWVSEKHRLPNGAEAGGGLRCLFTKTDDTHYRAHFRATWLCFVSGYEVTFQTQRRGQVLFFEGEQDLGAIFGGVYRYRGQVTPEQFRAHFASAYDFGRFEMSRPAKP